MPLVGAYLFSSSFRDGPQDQARNLLTPDFPNLAQAYVHRFRALGLPPAPRNDDYLGFRDSLEGRYPRQKWIPACASMTRTESSGWFLPLSRS